MWNKKYYFASEETKKAADITKKPNFHHLKRITLAVKYRFYFMNIGTTKKVFQEHKNNRFWNNKKFFLYKWHWKNKKGYYYTDNMFSTILHTNLESITTSRVVQSKTVFVMFLLRRRQRNMQICFIVLCNLFSIVIRLELSLKHVDVILANSILNFILFQKNKSGKDTYFRNS